MTAWLTVYRESAHVWRWLYTRCDAGEEPFVLPCATAYPSAGTAREAATSAYPGLPLSDPDDDPRREPLAARLLRRRSVRLVLVVAAVGGVVWWVRSPSSGRVHRSVLD